MSWPCMHLSLHAFVPASADIRVPTQLPTDARQEAGSGAQGQEETCHLWPEHPASQENLAQVAISDSELCLQGWLSRCGWLVASSFYWGELWPSSPITLTAQGIYCVAALFCYPPCSSLHSSRKPSLDQFTSWSIVSYCEWKPSLLPKRTHSVT